MHFQSHTQHVTTRALTLIIKLHTRAVTHTAWTHDTYRVISVILYIHTLMKVYTH